MINKLMNAYEEYIQDETPISEFGKLQLVAERAVSEIDKGIEEYKNGTRSALPYNKPKLSELRELIVAVNQLGAIANLTPEKSHSYRNQARTFKEILEG